MVESIFSKNTAKPGMIARLKVGGTAKAPGLPGLSAAENNLADLVQISGDAKTRALETRKLDAHLRVFSSALKFFNGFFSNSYKPTASTIDIEYVEMKKPGIDKKV